MSTPTPPPVHIPQFIYILHANRPPFLSLIFTLSSFFKIKKIIRMPTLACYFFSLFIYYNKKRLSPSPPPPSPSPSPSSLRAGLRPYCVPTTLYFSMIGIGSKFFARHASTTFIPPPFFLLLFLTDLFNRKDLIKSSYFPLLYLLFLFFLSPSLREAIDWFIKSFFL